MKYPLNALGLSHRYMADHLKSGDICIDATAGRGRDTLFLSELVGEQGKVYSFDIQKDAIESTRALLNENNVSWVKLFHACHSRMKEFVTEQAVQGIMFNFGWLPGGDHNLFSLPETSLAAIESGLDLLASGGVMTLCLYCGKETGYREKTAVLDYVAGLDQMKYSVLHCDFINRKNDPPVLIVITKD